MDADVIVVGAGLSGLVAAAELAEAGRRVIVLDQEGAANLGGQAHWSFGGLFLVDSPEQRRMGIRDSLELAWQDWQGSARFDRPEDHWPRQWAQAYVDFAAGEMRSWLHEQGMRWFPVVGWAERGDGSASGHGNSVPRFHITWGTGPGVLEPFVRRVRAGVAAGRVELRLRHRVDGLVVSGGAVSGVRGSVLAADAAGRGRPTSREVVGGFELSAQAVVVSSGGIGGNHELVRANWPSRLGTAPERMITGVPAYVDGRMLAIAQEAGGRVINPDRMWHYVEGIHNWDPDLAAARDPHPPRAELDVVRRAREPASRAALPGFRHPRHPRPPAPDGSRPLVVHPHPHHHRQGVRALRLGAEPRPDRAGRSARCSAGRPPTCPSRCGPSSTAARTSCRRPASASSSAG